jgi:Fur family ferric uptake transcriptional regulator
VIIVITSEVARMKVVRHVIPSPAPAAPYGARRTSAQRAAIARAAERLERAFTVEELAEATDRGPDGRRPGIATVYRAVSAMSAAGHVERVGDRDGRALYARCDAGGHHHHLVCTGCGSVAEAPCPLDAAALASAADQGFVVTRHEVAIYGLCPVCLGRPAGPGA